MLLAMLIDELSAEATSSSSPAAVLISRNASTGPICCGPKVRPAEGPEGAARELPPSLPKEGTITAASLRADAMRLRLTASTAASTAASQPHVSKARRLSAKWRRHKT